MGAWGPRSCLLKAWVEHWVPTENVSIRKSEGQSDLPAEGPRRADGEVAVPGSDPGLQGRGCHPPWNGLREHLVSGLHLQMRKLRPQEGKLLSQTQSQERSPGALTPGQRHAPCSGATPQLSQSGPSGVTSQPQLWVTQTMGYSNSSVLILAPQGGGVREKQGWQTCSPPRRWFRLPRSSLRMTPLTPALPWASGFEPRVSAQPPCRRDRASPGPYPTREAVMEQRSLGTSKTRSWTLTLSPSIHPQARDRVGPAGNLCHSLDSQALRV